MLVFSSGGAKAGKCGLRQSCGKIKFNGISIGKIYILTSSSSRLTTGILFYRSNWRSIMSNDAVAKFVSECSQFKQHDLAKSVEVGPTMWLLGSPTSAPDGMVGLATTPTQTVCFRREDILGARETEGRFLINIAVNTNLLVREEQVVRLN